MGKQPDDELAKKLERLAGQLQALAEELRAGDIEIPAEILRRFEIFQKANICLHCGKELTPPVKRGCHANCYATLMQRVTRGQTSERALVTEGRMRPGEKGGRKLEPLPPLPELDPVVSETVENALNTAESIEAGRRKSREEKQKKAQGKRATK